MFLPVRAALYVTMSIGWSVGKPVGRSVHPTSFTCNINPITVGGGSSGPECQKTAYCEQFIKTKILDFWLILMSMSCGHFKTIPSVLSGLCKNWRLIEVRSPEIFGAKILEFFLKTQSIFPVLTSE